MTNLQLVENFQNKIFTINLFMKNGIKLIISNFSFFVIILCWQICAKIIDSSLILPYPITVFLEIINIIAKSSFWLNFLHTFSRIIISFLISIILGSFIGILSGINQYIKQFFKLPLSIIKSTPVVAIILVALFWLKSSTIPIFVSVLMTLPIIATNVLNGFQNIDEKLIQMSNLYSFSFLQKFFKIKLHYVFPYFLSGVNSAFGLTWKVVIAGEILSLPKNAIGTVLSKAQVHLETQTVLAYTILIILFSYLLELLVSTIIKSILKRNLWNS